MSRYFVYAGGEPSSVSALPELLSGSTISATLVDSGRCLLVSSEFDTVADVSVLTDQVNQRLQLLAGLMHLYLGMCGRLYVASVGEYNEEGKIRWSALSNPFTMAVLDPSAKALFSQRTASGGTVCLGLLLAVERHPNAVRLLPLLEGGPLNWSGIYDILEGLGGLNRLVRQGYDTSGRLKAIFAKAGEARHPGRPPQSQRERNLPKERREPNPPTLREAQDLVFTILQKWLAEEAPEAPRSEQVRPPRVSSIWGAPVTRKNQLQVALRG